MTTHPLRMAATACVTSPVAPALSTPTPTVVLALSASRPCRRWLLPLPSSLAAASVDTGDDPKPSLGSSYTLAGGPGPIPACQHPRVALTRVQHARQHVRRQRSAASLGAGEDGSLEAMSEQRRCLTEREENQPVIQVAGRYGIHPTRTASISAAWTHGTAKQGPTNNHIPRMSQKENPVSQSYGIPGRTKDSKDTILKLFAHFTSNDCPRCDDDHGTICRHEVSLLGRSLEAHSKHVEQQYDAVLMSARILRVGETRETKDLVKDYQRVYNEPLPWPKTEKRQDRCTDPDVA